MAQKNLAPVTNPADRRDNLGVGYGSLTMTSRLRPDGYVAETFPRGNAQTVASAGSALQSGVLTCHAIWLPKDTYVYKIAYAFGATGSTTATNWWFALLDKDRKYLAQTADQLTAAIPAATLKSLPVAVTQSGPSNVWRTTYDGLHYVAIMVAASSMPTVLATGTSATLTGLPPILVGTSNGALTAPPPITNTAAAITPTASPAYACVG